MPPKFRLSRACQCRPVRLHTPCSNEPVRNRLVSLVAILLCGCACASRAQVGEFTLVQGKLRQTSYQPDGIQREAREWAFVVQKSSEKWTLECNEATPVPAGAAQRKRLAGDRHDLFYTLIFSPNPAASISTNGPLVHAHAAAGGFPAMAGGAELLIWLAYCSGPYLAAHGSLSSMREPFNDSLRPFVRTQYRVTDAGNPPTHLEQFSTCLVPYKPYGGAKPEVIRLPPPLDAGWLDFVYEAGNLTNVAGTTLPVSFRASYYLPEMAQEPRAYCATVLTGWVQSVGVITSPVLLDALPEAARVYDNRFTNQAGLPAMYLDKQGAAFVDRRSPDVLQQINTKQPLLPPIKPRERTWVRWAVLGSLAVALMLGPVLLIRGNRWNR